VSGYAVFKPLHFNKLPVGKFRCKFTLTMPLREPDVTTYVHFKVVADDAATFSVSIRPHTGSSEEATDDDDEQTEQPTVRRGDAVDVIVTVLDRHGNGTNAQVYDDRLLLKCGATATGVQLSSVSGHADRRSLLPEKTPATDTTGLILTWRNWQLVMPPNADGLLFTDHSTPLVMTLPITVEGI
jgi:hypothetical protein